jgi:glycosyltransferase involved in cell wall biosynthesis
MPPLVSVIIPCYNAARWVAQSIQSALDQTYAPIEIIVVDDGSTDASLDVIKSFGDKVVLVTGPNRGANHARNRGMALAQGEYLQFLDADDYLLPHKIERQMKAFQGGAADIIYEDWQRMEELPGGGCRWRSDPSGGHPDILEAFLGNWVPQVLTVLYSRRAFAQGIRWNEDMTSAQDWEMHIRLAMAGVSYQYLPGCYSVIRCPLAPTVSTRNPREMENNIIGVLKDAETRLREAGRLNPRYRRAMARAYLTLACGENQYFDRDRTRFEELLEAARKLSPSAVYAASPLLTLVSKTLGVRNAERIRSLKRRWLSPSPEVEAAKTAPCKPV